MIYVKTKAKSSHLKHTTHTRLFEPSDLINSQSSDFKQKRTAQKLPRKVIQRCSTAEYQHATKDANFSAQESLDERRRYVLSPHCLFREETFHASNKHDSWNIRNKVRTIVLLSRVSRYCARALKDVCKFPCVCFTLEVI